MCMPCLACTFLIFMNNKYDYIISGAGCAGLSLLMRMIRSNKFSDKKILLADISEKKVNDRTWCFWEKGQSFFEPLVCYHWEKLWFYAENYASLKQITPYTYKMIRGIDFYNYCFDIIRQQQNVTIMTGNVEKTESNKEETFAIINGEKISAAYIFNSIIFEQPFLQKKQFYLLQHFKGWIISSNKKTFNADEATLMDFRIRQQPGTSFFYVMPFSETKALVEYTLFTKKILPAEEYDKELKSYLHQFLQLDEYSIEEKEFGVIPMTNYSFPLRNNNIINIGAAGGRTKASSGYTFQSIQKQSTEIMNALINTGMPLIKEKNKKFQFYDSVLLNVLATGKLPGEKIFKNMFSKNSTNDIFNFLDNESNIFQDIRIIKSLPVLPFLRAAGQQIF